jgi:hypothetical protein
VGISYGKWVASRNHMICQNWRYSSEFEGLGITLFIHIHVEAHSAIKKYRLTPCVLQFCRYYILSFASVYYGVSSWFSSVL